MLVYAKGNRSAIKIGNYRIYGRALLHGPTDIPFELYQSHKNALEDATYREGSLQHIFDCKFPEVAFKYGQLKLLPDKTLDKIGRLLDPKYSTTWSYKHKVDAIKTALREASPNGSTTN
jgi:hypothetical protein